MANFSFITDIAEHIAQYHTTFAGQPATPINILHILKDYIGSMGDAEIGATFEATFIAGFTTFITFRVVDDGFRVTESRDLTD